MHSRRIPPGVRRSRLRENNTARERGRGAHEKADEYRKYLKRISKSNNSDIRYSQFYNVCLISIDSEKEIWIGNCDAAKQK